jgi:nicotinamide mononucleotide (NMN) deamidase PncC
MDRVALITQIHVHPAQAVLVVTGGGAQAVADLLAVPGASRTLLEALVPYSEPSLIEFLGALPTQAVSVETAAALAKQAFQRAIRLRKDKTVPVIGLACTATLVTERPKKGEHRAHLGLCTADRIQVYSLTLRKGARDRHGEERLVSDLLLSVLAQGCDLPVSMDLALLPEEAVTLTEVEHGAPNL